MKSQLSFCLLTVCMTALAEPQSLPPVVVTATRTAQTVDETLASVSVISRQDIEIQQPLSVQDALRGVPGLGISNAGGLGKASDVFLRGTNSGHVLVLVDGVRAGSATLGTTAFQDIPIDQVERIEIVRGPRSSLYGSEAIGGVIQIFTRKGGEGHKPFLSAGAGSYDTYKVSGGISGGDERAWYQLSAGEIDTRGINACQGRPFPAGGGCYTFEPDKDGYENTSGSARAGYRFDDGAELEASLLQAEGRNHYDGTLVNQSRTTQQLMGGKLKLAPRSFWDATLRIGNSLDQSDNDLNGLFKSRFDTSRFSLSQQNDFILTKNHLLSAGFDYYDDSITSTEHYQRHSRDNKAGFLQYQGELSGHKLALSMRHDSNQQFGGKSTGNAAWGYGFGEALRLSASFGTAFKAPTFNDLYWPASAYYSGNPKLRPESSASFEVGGKGKLAGVDWAVNGYQTQVDEMITFDAQSKKPQNIAKAEILGLEGQVSARIFGWQARFNLSWLDPVNRGSGPNHGNLLPRRAQQMSRLDLDRAFGRFRVGLTVNQEGRRFDDLANTIRLRGFTTVDLRAGYEPFRDILVEGRIGNLFNEHYQTAYLYNQMGMNLFLSVSYKPGETL
ncbi:MAG: TonB-dependent vitamin B12 receptor [Methylococcaceae bacterium]|nr:TonB-dependent vitamin B12 receptor [Methylococcaceae bacterium]